MPVRWNVNTSICFAYLSVAFILLHALQLLTVSLVFRKSSRDWQGCGVGVEVEESESEGFSTWGVGVVENFNDSDSGKTFCSPIVTVCATNVRKRHTWQFKQLDASTRDDLGYSDRRQSTNLHTFTQGPFQSSSVPWAHHATYTLWMQPFGACITEISICSFWLTLSLLRDVDYSTMNESSHGSSSIVT